MDQIPRSEEELTVEIIRMARSQFTYTESSYASILAELTEAVTRRVRRETREEAVRIAQETHDYWDKESDHNPGSDVAGMASGSENVLDALKERL